MYKIIVLRTGRADFPYNAQIWNEWNESGTIHRIYAERGKFCKDFDAVMNYAESEGLKIEQL